MSARQSKHARAIAYAEATRQHLWKQGENGLGWWRRFIAKLFPRLRRKYAGWVGRWYKRVLKRWARQVYANLHDPDFEAMERARKKTAKKRLHDRLNKQAAARDMEAATAAEGR